MATKFRKQPMLLFCIIFLMYTGVSIAQVYNIKAGKWSEAGTWLNNHIPIAADSVVLNYDLIIDETSYCKSLISNGHSVTVNSGATIIVLSPAGTQDSVFDELVVIDTTIAPGKDTLTIISYNYDEQKRLIRTDYLEKYNNDSLRKTSKVLLEYTGNSVFPSKASTTGVSTFHRFYNEQGQLVKDSLEYFGSTQYGLFLYRYSGDTLVIDEHDIYDGDTVFNTIDTVILKKTNGNIISEDYKVWGMNWHASFDDHPNPMFISKNLDINSPFILGNSIIRSPAQQNNYTRIKNFDYKSATLKSDFIYEYVYKLNGYPLYFRSFYIGSDQSQPAYIGTGYYKYRKL